VNSGPSAIVISTLATVVSVSAIMKAVYMTAQHTLETQKARSPPRMRAHSARGPRIQPSMTAPAPGH
jgi:hypothetical protein